MARLTRLVDSLKRTIGAQPSPLRHPSLHATAVLYPTGSIVLQGRAENSITVGANTHVRGELLVFGHGGKVRIGDWCYVGEQTRIWSSAEIRIGNRVLISHLCTIMDNLTHPFDPEARHRQFRQIVERGFPDEDDLGERPVSIEDDALIGAHCVVLRGATIGRGAIIGAGSVVTRDVPAMQIWAGNPARYIGDVKQAG